jgi:trimeric autotransporter adhesin
MKPLASCCYLLAIFLLLINSANAQRVGIGITSPVYKLDVRGGSINTDSVYRVAGATFMSAKSGNYLIGAGDGAGISSGTHNVAIGLALPSLTTGSENIGIGTSALGATATGSNSIALGLQALQLYTGSDNIAIGRMSMRSNVTGILNVAVGVRTLELNTSVGNTAIGAYAMQRNTVGQYCTAVGHQALENITNGYYNVAIGNAAMGDNTTGHGQVAVGYDAMQHNTTGVENTAIGKNAMLSSTTGSGNTVIGNGAGISMNTASYNTLVGYRAGGQYNLGWNNTIIGANADVNGEGLFNCIAIGNIAQATSPSMVRIGNSSNNSYQAFANWTNISDARYKKNIVENVPGISFIRLLRPVTYKLDVTSLSALEMRGLPPSPMMQQAIKEKEAIVWTGFVAQEVEQAAIQLGFNFSGVDKPRNNAEHYGLRYAEFVVPLVKAVQEQQVMIEELKKELSELKKLGTRMTRM